MAALLASAALVLPTFAMALGFGIAKDGSPFRRSFWTS